jgi:hypothetical protein
MLLNAESDGNSDPVINFKLFSKASPFLLLFHLLMINSWASQDVLFGLGGRTTGRTGAVIAETENAYAALYNPALIAAQSKGQFSIGTMGTSVQYSTHGEGLIDSTRYRTLDGENRSGAIQIPNQNSILWSLGYSQPLAIPFWREHRSGIGISLSGPFDKLRRYSSSSAFDFGPLRFGTSDGQFKATTSTSLELLKEKLFLGGGINIYMSSSGVSETTSGGENPSGRMIMDVGLNTAAVFGLYAKQGFFSGAAVYRQAINPTFSQKILPRFALNGRESPMPSVQIDSSFYYEPALFETEAQFDLGGLVLVGGISYQWWSGYKPSYLNISSQDANGKNRSSIPPEYVVKDTWNPRVALEKTFWKGNSKISAGYQYRPTPVADLSGSGNLIDSTAHIVGLSFEQHLFSNQFLFSDIRVALSAQYQWMPERTVVKSSSEYIGAPGYSFSGKTWVYGLSIHAQL